MLSENEFAQTLAKLIEGFLLGVGRMWQPRAATGRIEAFGGGFGNKNLYGC
jgi:hypothetical protein